jgi:hypothetical protein
MKGHSVHLHVPHFHPRISGPTFASIMIVLWTIITLILAALFVYATASMLVPKPSPNTVLQVERYPGPAISEIIALGENLRLSDQQYASLGMLEVTWSREREALEHEFDIAERAAANRLKSSRGKSGVSIAAMITGYRSYDDVATQYAFSRDKYFRRALNVLDSRQRVIFGGGG